MKIAIIEDEKDHFDLMKEAIKKEFPDSEVDLFEKADLLLESLDLSACGDAQAGKTMPDIIIADYFLSDINGIELFEEVKSRKIDIPFIVVTGHGNEDIAVKAMKLGAYDYIVKSMNFFDLLPEIIRKALKARELKIRAEQAEEELQKYKLMVESSNDAMFIKDLKNSYALVNKKTLELFGGVPAEKIIGKNDKDLMPLEDAQLNIMDDQEVFKTGKIRDFVKKNTIEGKNYWFHATKIPLKDDKGKVTGLIGIARDITEQKRSEQALKESEEKYRTILESIEDGYFEENINGSFTFFNNSLCKIFGYRKDELIGMNYRKYMDKENARKAYLTFSKLYTTGKPVKIADLEIIRKDGTKRSVEISGSLIKDSKGQKIGFRGIIRDVTERKKMEAELLKTKDFLQNIFDSSIDGITATDLKGKIISITANVKDILGYNQSELIGKKTHSLYSEGIEDAKKIMSELMAKGELRNHEIKLIKKDGGLIDVNFSISLLKNEKGETIGTLGTYRDITEKKKLESQLQHAQKMEAIGTLAGGIAHDFNNILMGIQGYTSLMLIDIDSTHPHYERHKGIEQQVQRGAELTRQLLGFARGGKYEVKPADINELIRKTSNMFGRTKKEMNIHRKYQKDIFTVEIDQGQIDQVMLNLYVNAWQAMPGGGQLYLQTENVTLAENYVKPYDLEPGRYVKISVTDTGVGMDEKIQQRIFEPFFTTREMGRGTGLGLASAYGIIKNHGGIINVYSVKGEGATFNIYLPASEKEVIEERELSGKILKGSETILLVDDEDMIIDVGKEILKTMGYEVLLARSGIKAIKIYEKNKDKIDMVILDMIMPDMGGGEAYDKLKEINPDIKVLLSSGYSINGQATEILERGCDGFIQKPFNMKQLSQRIREVLDRKGHRSI